MAQASRRDLRRINRMMGNFRWIARSLERIPDRGRVCELGAGDGSLGKFLARSGILSSREADYAGIDRIGKDEDWPEAWPWYQTDLRTFHYHKAGHVLVGNLILHHFTDGELQEIGASIRSSGVEWLVLNEPRRSRLPLFLMTLSRLIGMHPVTLHDARVSIRAGFQNHELASLLGLSKPGWEIRVSESLLGANRLCCRKRCHVP